MKVADKTAAEKNGHTPKPESSELGKELRRVRQQILASGEKLLNPRELEREIADRRSGNF